MHKSPFSGAVTFALHSPEHGAVWITYRPDLPTEQIQRLQEITQGGSQRLLAPYSNLESPIVVSAWGYQLQLTETGDNPLTNLSAITRNVDKHLNRVRFVLVA